MRAADRRILLTGSALPAGPSGRPWLSYTPKCLQQNSMPGLRVVRLPL